MSICTYIASDVPFADSSLLWPLSLGGEDIYTEKKYVAQLEPELSDLTGVTEYLREQLKKSEEIEVWHIWQGVEYEPVIRSREIPVDELSEECLRVLMEEDVLATTTQYEIPVQYRIVIKNRQ